MITLEKAITQQAVATQSDDTTRTPIKDLSMSMAELSVVSGSELHVSELML
jgi:hypothetical protein